MSHQHEYVIENVLDARIISEWNLNYRASEGYRLVFVIPYNNATDFQPDQTGVQLIFEREKDEQG